MDAKLLVILSLVAAAIAGPLSTQDSNECATQCIESTNFKYNPRTTYVYDYKVDTDSSLAGAFEHSAKTTLQTTVNIEVLSQCEFSLQLTNSRLSHSNSNGAMKTADRENEFRTEIEQSPLRFSFQNGVVDHVCAGNEESVRSLNLKKGILSAFQNGMDDLTKSVNVTETDVVGTCKAEYKLVSNGYYTTEVKKVKDILSCTDRLDFLTMAQLTPYNVPSDLQNVPIMKTSHECDQTIENGGVLKTSVCKESHVYRPFANGESGARTTITQTLTYQTYRSGVSRTNGNVQSKSTLLFDHSADHLTKEQSRMSVEKTLNAICESTSNDIRPETPRLFTELVVAMKGLDKTDLTELHRLLKTETLCPTNLKAYKFFHDALPMLNTKASVSLMTQLINTKDVTGAEATAWLTSFAFIQTPSSDMLLDAKTLLDNNKVRADAMLPVSSMVNNFCKNMGTCNQDYAVLSLISSMEKNIDYSCDASGDKFEMTLLTLKALGNAGHSLRAIPVLNKCLTSTSNPLEIRVAAAEAFRRMPCAPDNDLLTTFTDTDLDSELRINAYLAMMRCPTQETLAKVVAILNAEEDEQVGAFVYSHLTNLRETSDPHKQTVADSINNLALDKEFDLSPLKFSRNFEVSALLNKINTGVTAESNLIWSNKVQLPRAVSGNLTVQLFGQSINLLDFGGRLEGLEYLIKNIFGPYINTDGKSKIDADNVKGSFYGRLFGNEMLFMHSQTTKSLFGEKTPTYLDMLIKMSNMQQVALTQSVQFMDICMVIPTSAGLPIHMNVNGTATVDLKMSGKMDLRKVGASPRSMDVDGEIRPSAALEVTGSMFVDSFVTKTGLRMRNTMHTSSAVKGRIQMNRGQQLNVELDTPEERMDVFDARSQFVLLHDDMEQEQEMVKDNRKEFKFCSGNQMTQITGMEICGELSFPNASMKADSPYFPLTGPTSASVTVFKRDSHTGYKLFAKRVENRKASMAQVSINTPGSQVNRAISVDMTLNYKKQDIEMNLASPWKKLAVNGNLMNSKDMKSLKGTVVIDDKDTYAMTGEVKVSQSKNKIQFNPMFELRRPGVDNVQVTGFVSMEKPFKAVNMEMSLSGINTLPYTIKSALTNTNKEKSVEASLSLDGKTEYNFKSSNKMSVMGKKSIIAVIQSLLEVQSPQRKLMALSTNVDYRQDKSLKFDTNLQMYRVLKKPVTLKVNLLKTARKKSSNYKGIMNLKSSSISGSVVCNVNKKPSGFLSVTTKLDYTIPRVAKNTINLSGKLNDRSTKAYTSYIIQSNIGVKKNPEYNSNMKLELGHKKKLSYVSADVKYGANPKDKTKRVYFLTSVNRKIPNMKNALVNYKVKAQAPAHEIDVLLTGKHQHSPKLLDTSATLTYAPKKAINAGVTLRNKGGKLAKVSGKAILSWPGQEYLVNTDLTQKNAKQYAHVLNLKSSSGTKHSISTVYKMPGSDAHDIVASFRLQGMKPVTVSASTNLNMKNFAASGEFKTGKNTYGINTLAKFSKAPSAKMSLELIHPSRRVTLDVNGGKGRGKYEGSIETAWDADNDKTQKMSIGGSYFRKATKGSVSMGGNVDFQSPFARFENLGSSFKYGMDASQHAVNGKFLWGDKSEQIMTTMTVKKPISLNNLQLNGNVKTPFRGFRTANIDIAHKMNSDVSTTISGGIEKETAKLTVQGQKLSNGYKGNMNLKSTIKNAESVSLSASHTDVGNTCNSNAELKHNGKVYGYELTMSNTGNGWQRETIGDLVLTLKKQKIATHWDHKNTDASVKSSLSSKWNNNRLAVDLIGSHELSTLRNINGVLKIKSPWKPVRDVELNIDHKHGSGLLDSVAFYRQGSSKKASSVINFKSGQNSHDFDFMIASPWNEDLSGKLNTNYDNYPLTTSAELKWAPKMKGTLEGSLDLASWNNADLNLKMTTPSRIVRNVVLKASNKKENGETVSNLNLDYGMRQNIDVESRITNEDQNKMLRLKLSTPFKQIKSLNTGLNFNGNSYKFDSTADFEVLPSIGKFDGAVNWQYDNELSGKIRVDTPFTAYPYFELSTSSNLDGALRKSHIQAEYHPRQVYSLDTTYGFGSPLSFDATIRSPYPQFDDIGMSIKHNMADSSVKCHGEVKYQPNKKIEADVDADWSSDLEGNLVVKTPFSGYENSKISMRHRGDLNNFDSHGEVNVAEQNVVADASFKSGYTTTGTFTFSSPIPALKSIDMSLRKKGKIDNLKGGATIKVNGDKFQTTFSNKMTTDSLKTNFNLMTPHTEAIKFAIDHSGPINSFTNKVNFIYGRKVDIDTIASFDLRENDVNGNGILKYKLGNGRNTARVSFSKSGPIEDVTFSTSANFNRDDITVTGSLRTTGGIDGSLQIKTPIDNFKNTGVTVSHSGDVTEFTSNANINYMDNKNINGKVEFSSRNGMKLSSELTTPFRTLESTSVKVNHDINEYSGDVSGSAVLTTTIGEFGTGDITYSKTGDLNDLVLKGSASLNGKDMANLKLTNNMQSTEMHSMCSVKSFVTPDMYFSIDHSGDSFSFNTKTMGKIGKNMVSTDANMKRAYDTVSADSSITYKIQGHGKNTASINIEKDGPLDNCNMALTGKFNNDEVKVSTSRSGALNDMRFSGSASYNRKSIDVSGNWKYTDNIDGTLKVLTPFDNFNKVGMVISHSGDLSDFTTSFNVNYMDDKNINGKVELVAYPMNNIKFVTELMTPFESFETLNMKFNNRYDTYTFNLNGNAAIDTTIAGFGTGSIVYSKTGGSDNLEIVGNALRNGVDIAELKITNLLQDMEVHSSFEYKSTVTPHVVLTLDHNGDMSNLKTSASASLGKNVVVTAETTLNQQSDVINGEGKLMYNIRNFGNNQVSLNVHKEGQLNNFNVVLTGKNGAKTSRITGNFKNENELTGDLTVNTPVDGYKNVGLSFKHSGSLDRFNCEGKMTLTDGEEFSGKIDFYRSLLRRIEAVAELNTPLAGIEFTKFEYRHEGESDSFTCSSTLQYGNSQRITYDMSATSSPKPEMSITLKMPQEQYLVFGSYENTWPRYSVNGKLDAGNGRSISVDGSLDASNDIVGALTLTTPFDDFTNVGLSFQHTPKSNGIESEGRITYMDGQVISGKAGATMTKNGGDATFELTTPFSGYEFTRFETKNVANRRIMKTVTKFVYGNNKKITVDAFSKIKPTPEFSFTVTSPLSEDIEVFVSLDNVGPKYELTSKMTPGNGERFTLGGTFDSSKDISGSLTIETPFDNFNKIGMNFMHSGDSEKFGTEGTVTYMDGQEIFGKVDFYRYMWRRVDASMELTTPFTGMEATKAKVNFEDNSNSISTTASLEYFNGQKLNGDVKVTYSPSYDVTVTLNTPVSVVKAQGALDMTAPNYEILGSLDYDDDKVYSANGKFNFYSAENLDGSLEVNTPLTGFEYTKAEYEHKMDSSELTGSVSLTYNDGKKMSCDVKSTISPNFDGSVTVKTPFRGFENMQGSATFESSYKRYESSSSLNLGQGSIFSMTSELDYSIEPMKASTKINTPFRNFRNIELDLTHEGGLTNFKTTGFLSSPLTDHVNAKASLRYDAVMDMSAAASLQSSIEGFGDLKAELKTSDVAGEMKTNALFGWTSGQQVTFDNTFRKQAGWNEDKMHADVSITTPFVAVRSMNMQMDTTVGSDSYSKKMNFELNGDSLLDYDVEINFNEKTTAELLVRQPWPMQYTATYSSSDVEVFANWNRDESDSNVRAQATYTDNSDSYKMDNTVDVSVTYASRKVGVVNHISNDDAQLLSNGHVYWDSDDDSKVSYDLQINENNRRRKQIVDGSFKLGLPTRTLGLTGSYSENSALVSTDVAFSWDADRDDSKQVGVKTNVRLGDNLKGDITLSMPSLRKEIRVDGEVMLNNGRVILDTKTDISYSKDSRKTLTLTSKLEDISTGNSHFNYSLALGLRHAYTNVDVAMNSHIGSSDESMTFGVSSNYLTSKRQMKNLALLSEINLLKKQISVQVFNPSNSFEIVGDVASQTPYKLRLMNKINGQETFRSDVTFDKTRKSVVFNTFSDADILTLAAKYPNSSAFRVDFSRHTPDFDQEEALMAVRLNTSRLLHTRLSWRTDMMEDFKAYAWPKVMEMSESAIIGFAAFNEEFAEELTSKYSAITNEMSQELQPFITALDEELALVAEKMNELSDELRKMYDNNDLYIQKMGESVLKLQAKMERLAQEYTTTYTQLMRSLRENLYEMRRFNAGANYKHFMTQTSAWMLSESMKSLASLELYMAEVDMVLNEYKQSMVAMKQKAMDAIYNTTYVDYLSSKIPQFDSIDISPYISSFDIPQQYTNAIYEIPSKVNDILDRSDVKFVKEGFNEVFQQGVWAYNYWQLEENLEKHAKSILKTLKEIVEEEVKEYAEDIKDIVKSPITVWDPEHGEIQAEFPLPIAVHRLDETPDMSQIITKVEKFADTYLPDETTWNTLVESVSELMPAKSDNKTTTDGISQQLTKYKPSKKYRKKGRKYKVRRSRQ